MKRDFDLIRSILIDIEKMPAGTQRDEFTFPGYDDAMIYQHIGLLIEADLVKGEFMLECGLGHSGALVSDLTWAGHDFLDAMKDDNLWTKAKEHVIKPGASFTFDLLLEWLKAKAKEKIGLS